MPFANFFSTIVTLGVTLSCVSAYPGIGNRADVCFEDNALRGLERYSQEASAFCPKYLASSTVTIPKVFQEIQTSRVSSACKCFVKTAVISTPTATSTKSLTTSTTSTKSSIATTPSSTSSKATLTATSSTSSTTSTKTSATSTSTSSLPIKTATGSANGIGKRGLVYDYTSKTAYGDYFKGSKYVSFCSNWGSKRAIGNSVTLDEAYTFVPTLRVDGSLNNNDWVKDAAAAIKSGSKYLFSTNEPDNAGQGNLSPERTAEVYKKYMNQFQGQALLATPAVTNGGGSTGLNFLGKFVDACQGCHFDIINIHHYVPRSQLTVDQAVSNLKSYIEKDVPALQAQHPQLQGLRIVIGEFWLWDASEAEGGEYLQKMMPYLDSNDAIIGYQAFGGLWPGNFISDNGSGLTPAGKAYKDAS